VLLLYSTRAALLFCFIAFFIPNKAPFFFANEMKIPKRNNAKLVKKKSQAISCSLKEKKRGHNSQGTTNTFSSTGEIQSQNDRYIIRHQPTHHEFHIESMLPVRWSEPWN
jgi:hypothetical protein